MHMDKVFPETPPMGWNSWDCYGASVREDEVLANARFMADKLLKFGWQYVTVDIQWRRAGRVRHRVPQSAAAVHG